MIHHSPSADVEFPDVPVTKFVFRYAEQLADREAITDGLTGQSYTYGQLVDRVARVAGGLRQLGIGPGSVVAIMAPNCPEYAVAFHAIATAGGTVTTINPTYKTSEVHHQLVDSGAVLIITVCSLVELADEAATGTAVTHAVTMDGDDEPRALAALLGDPINQVAVDRDVVVALPYSSGTTGMPKGVMLTHANLTANLTQASSVLDIGRDDVVLAVLPFFHIYGMQVLMNGVLAYGGTVITLPRFDLETALRLIRDRKITIFYAVPPIVVALAKHPLVDKFDLSSLRLVFSGAAPLGGDLAQEAAARVGCEVIQGYGMTELSPVSHATRVGDFKAGSIGTIVPNTECRLVTPDGRDSADGEPGEIWIRGPQVMKGYHNNTEATAATVDDDGWLHTGDVGIVDADGHFFIVDRVKELIKVKGFQVAPAELEALLITHPDVADVAVIGIPDENGGEGPKAFVVLKPDAPRDADSLKKFVTERVASYKQLREVEFLESIPKSPAGKILRRVLRNQE